VLVMLAWVLRGEKQTLLTPQVQLFAAFIVLSAASFFWAVNHYWVYQNTRILASYLIVVILPMVAFASHPDRFRTFLKVWIVIQLIVALVAILKGGQGSGGFLQDENDLAMVATAAMPFAWFLAQSKERSLAGRLFCYGTLIVLMGAVVSSGSRGGFVAMMGSAAAIAWFAKQRVKLMVVAGIIGIIGSAVVGQTYMEEMKTITNTQERTAHDRLYSWRRGWEMFLDNPIIGVGSGNYPWRVADYERKSPEYTPNMRLHGGRAAHSLYFTLIPEYGLIGTALFATLAVSLFMRLNGARRRLEQVQELVNGDLDMARRATAASLVAFFVGAIFLSVLSYPVFWISIGVVLALDGAIRVAVAKGQPALERGPADVGRRRWRGGGPVAEPQSNAT